MSDSLRSLTKNELPWAIPSGRSEEMSESLRSLTKNERMSESLIFLSESIICSFLAKKERFARKTDERIPSPGFLWIESLLCVLKRKKIVKFNV